MATASKKPKIDTIKAILETKATETTKKIGAKTEDFDEDLFETRLESLKDTQDGIQAMSLWCLNNRAHHKKIVSCWLNVFKRVRVEHRLTLFYLANDVIQYSKRKRYEFVEAWATALQRATTMVRDAKVKGKILRIFNIWEQREIYNEEFLTDLSGLLNISPAKRTDAPTEPGENEFQSTQLVQSIRECMDLAECTDRTFKKLPKAPNTDIDEIKQQLKDKIHHHNVSDEIDRYATYIEAFQKILNDEIKSRKQVIANLNKAIKFYAQQRSDVKVVVTAYKNFGNRIKLVKKKVDEMQPELPSPIPSPDINAPSPERDAELKLPDEEPSPPNMTYLNKTSMNGFASYIGEKLPFNLNDFKDSTRNTAQPIEVIGSRSDDESFTSTGSGDVSNLNANFYKPDIGLGLSGYGAEVNIPGLNPLPVPPVAQSEYTSLARAAQHYSGNSATDYLSSYSADAGYGIDMYGHTNNNIERANSSSINRVDSNSGEYTPVWDMSSVPAWNTAASTTNNTFTPASSMDTPVSPQNFETAITHEFPEHNSSNSSTTGTRDGDQRQLNLATDFLAGNTVNKLGLSKEKTRQLDIDHRNLISLTGSPINNEVEKKTQWPVTTNNETNYAANCEENFDFQQPKSKTNTRTIENGANTEKNTVVDMDMSDEDMESLYQEINGNQSAQKDESEIMSSATAPGNNAWDPNIQANANSSYPPPPPPPPPPLPVGMDLGHNNWPIPWNNPGLGAGAVPSPPRPPAAFPGMNYGPMGVGPGGNFAGTGFNRSMNMNDGRGRGRGGWRDGPQNQYRQPRPPLMRPYFNRGNCNPSPRARGNPFRGKFRGNSSWI